MKKETVNHETASNQANQIGKERLAEKTLENTEDGEKATIVWLDGKAPEQHNDKPVDISGTITAPAIFVSKRKEVIEPLNSHCLASKTNGTMKLVINEQSVCNKFTITGQVEIGKRFKELGINEDKAYSPFDLAKKFKLLRSIFPSRTDHTAIVGLLRNIEAKIKADVDNKDDARGNVEVSYKQALETNIPESFQLKLPLIEGADPTIIDVDIIMELEGGRHIKCYLESMDGADLIEEAMRTLVEEEVAKIEDTVTVMYH